MATDIAGLFGITPQAYNQQQQQLINAEAQQFAQLDPYQQVTAGSYGAGRQLGRGIVGALGGEDPQLKIISLRNQIAKNMNPNDLNSVQQAAQALASAGDQQGALQLSDYLRKAQGDYALIQQRTAEKMTPEQRNAEAKAGLMDVISQLENMPASPERDRALTMRKNQLTSLTAGKPEKVADAIQVANQIGILTEALTKTQEGTPEYNNIKAQINRLQKTDKTTAVQDLQEYRTKRVQEGAPTSEINEITNNISKLGGSVSVVQNVSTGAVKAGADMRKTVQATIEPQRQMLNATDNALANLDNSIKNPGDFASFRAAQVQFAKAMAGTGDLSGKELKAAGVDPSLLGGFQDFVSTTFTSTPSADTQLKMKKALETLRNLAINKGNKELDVQRKIALNTPGITQADVDRELDFPDFKQQIAAPKGARTITLKSGKTVTVTED